MEPEIIADQLGTQELLLQIIEKSDGVAILFTIIILIGIVIGGIPILKMLQSHRKNQNALEMEERKTILEIVQQNTEALQALKSTNHMSSVSTNLHLQNIAKSSSIIEEKLSSLITALSIMDNNFQKTTEDISIMKEKADVHINNVSEHQRMVAEKIEKVDDILVRDIPLLIEKIDHLAELINKNISNESLKEITVTKKIPKK